MATVETYEWDSGVVIPPLSAPYPNKGETITGIPVGNRGLLTDVEYDADAVSISGNRVHFKWRMLEDVPGSAPNTSGGGIPVNKRMEFRETPWGNVHTSGDKIWYGFKLDLENYSLHPDTSLSLHQCMSAAQGDPVQKIHTCYDGQFTGALGYNVTPGTMLIVNDADTDSDGFGTGGHVGNQYLPQDGISYVSSPSPTPPALIPTQGDSLYFVFYVKYGDQGNGEMKIWVKRNNEQWWLRYDKSPSNASKTSVRTEYGAGNGANIKMGLYHHQIDDGSVPADNPPGTNPLGLCEKALNSYNAGQTSLDVYLGTLRIVEMAPSDPDYNNDLFSLVDPTQDVSEVPTPSSGERTSWSTFVN